MVGNRRSRGASGLLGQCSAALSKKVSCGPRPWQRGLAWLWGHGPQWSEKPCISMSLRAAVSKVVHRLFIHEIFMDIHDKLFMLSWRQMSVRRTRFSFNYLMLISEMCRSGVDMCMFVIVLLCRSILLGFKQSWGSGVVSLFSAVGLILAQIKSLLCLAPGLAVTC